MDLHADKLMQSAAVSEGPHFDPLLPIEAPGRHVGSLGPSY